jgi:hypothetical protein
MVRLSAPRLVAAALALAVTAGIGFILLRGTREQRISGAAANAAVAQADPFCGPGLVAGLSLAPNPAHAGRYANPLYRYAVTVPAGLTGYTGVAAAPRGFTVPLGGAVAADLRVDAAYDALYDVTAAGVHTRDTMNVRLFDRLVSDHAEPASLDGAPGGRYRMQVMCPGSTQIHVFDDVIVMRNREIYRLELQTTPQRAPQDELLLEQMLASWRWLP